MSNPQIKGQWIDAYHPDWVKLRDHSKKSKKVKK